MTPPRQRASARAKGKRPAESLEPEARRKARFDTHLFSTTEEQKRYKQIFAKRKVMPGRDVDFVDLGSFGFQDLFVRMGWLPILGLTEPVFPSLVRAFYSKLNTLGNGTISCNFRGVQIELDADMICQILEVPSVGIRVYEYKTCPVVPGFDIRRAVQYLCGLEQSIPVGKPSASSLTVRSRVLHHILTNTVIPRAGHKDEVSYFEAFLMDSIYNGRRVHLGHVMLYHMIGCSDSRSRALPYGRFLTKLFKHVGIDLSNEKDMEGPSSYDTYNSLTLARMKFEKAPDGTWRRKDDLGPLAGAEDEEGDLEPQTAADEGHDLGPDIPHPTEHPQVEQTTPVPGESTYAGTPPTASHPPPHPAASSDLLTEFIKLGTRLDDLVLGSEQRMTNQMDGFGKRLDEYDHRLDSFHDETSAQYAQIQGRLEYIESSMAEMMGLLRASLPPPPPPQR